MAQTTKKERVQIFIDGGNFYHLVLKKFDVGENDFSFDGCANKDCPCHQSESIELEEINNKITDLIQRLPFEKRGEIWTLIYESRKQAITNLLNKLYENTCLVPFHNKLSSSTKSCHICRHERNK